MLIFYRKLVPQLNFGNSSQIIESEKLKLKEIYKTYINITIKIFPNLEGGFLNLFLCGKVWFNALPFL